MIEGNVTATSATIAGAVKGDIDINGPVIIDSSAVVVGNVKTKSVQVNTGAVIKGYCSQDYADVDLDKLFGNSAEEVKPEDKSEASEDTSSTNGAKKNNNRKK